MRQRQVRNEPLILTKGDTLRIRIQHKARYGMAQCLVGDDHPLRLACGARSVHNGGHIGWQRGISLDRVLLAHGLAICQGVDGH